MTPRQLLGRALLALGLASAATRGASAAERFTLAPPAPWVDDRPLPSLPEGAAQREVPSGIYYLLVDHQAKVGTPTAHYYRRAWTPVSNAGLQGASEIKISFDPEFERLVIHHVRLLRRGRDVGHFGATDVKVIQAESGLAEGLYSGELTALVFLEDLRVGDTVEWAYTLEGQNPILDGRFVDDLPLAFSTPVRCLRHRVLAPTGRPLHIRPRGTSLKPALVEGPLERSYTWEALDVPAIPSEEGQPGWFDPFPGVDVGEFSSWAEIARWSMALFEGQIGDLAPVAELARTIRGRARSPEAAVTAAVRFVQDEIRYLGIETGPSSHRPHPPAATLRQRFGDCKDKSLLLTVLLRQLGVEAAPALVHSRRRRALDQRQPSPFAFNHVVVWARVGTRGLWIDATASHQGGTPSHWVALPFERALVLQAGTTALTTIAVPEPQQPTVGVDESYSLPAQGPAELTVRTTYRGSEADGMRRSLADEPQAEMAKSYLNYYSHADPDIHSAGELRTEDDRDANVVVVSETYQLPSFWKSGARDLSAAAIRDRLVEPETTRRVSPFSLPHPVHVRHVIRVRPAPTVDLSDCTTRLDRPAFLLEVACEISGNELRVTHTYHSRRDVLTPQEVAGYLEAVDEVRQASDVWVHARAGGVAGGVDGGGVPAGVAWMGLAVVAALGIWGLWAGVVELRLWRRRVAFRRLARLGPGTSPATALHASGASVLPFRRKATPGGDSPGTALHAASAAALEELVAARTCACGAKGGFSVMERHKALYDRRSIDILTVRCERCAAQNDVYAWLSDSPEK